MATEILHMNKNNISTYDAFCKWIYAHDPDHRLIAGESPQKLAPRTVNFVIFAQQL